MRPALGAEPDLKFESESAHVTEHGYFALHLVTKAQRADAFPTFKNEAGALGLLRDFALCKPRCRPISEGRAEVRMRRCIAFVSKAGSRVLRFSAPGQGLKALQGQVGSSIWSEMNLISMSQDLRQSKRRHCKIFYAALEFLAAGHRPQIKRSTSSGS